MKTAPVHYAITAPHPHQHLWHVTLTISQPQAEQMVMAIARFNLGNTGDSGQRTLQSPASGRAGQKRLGA